MYRSLAEMFLSQAGRRGDRVLYRFARNGHWESYTWREALCRVREIALGLVSLGVQKGDRVAIFSAHRVEWSLTDWANICIGALTVPIYSSSTPSQLSHILSHSGSAILFVESPEQLAKMNSLGPSFPQETKIVVMDPGNQSTASSTDPMRGISLYDLKKLARRNAKTRN